MRYNSVVLRAYSINELIKKIEQYTNLLGINKFSVLGTITGYVYIDKKINFLEKAILDCGHMQIISKELDCSDFTIDSKNDYVTVNLFTSRE
jgi:hypothetical protein